MATVADKFAYRSSPLPTLKFALFFVEKLERAHAEGDGSCALDYPSLNLLNNVYLNYDWNSFE